MTPDTLAKTNTEHAHQRAFFAWLAMASYHGFEGAKVLCEGGVVQRGRTVSPLPELRLMHAIPNGGKRDAITAGKLKAEGVKAGVLDTFLPVPKPFTYPVQTNRDTPAREGQSWYCGLYVEFKEPNRKTHKDGGVSDTQAEFMEGVRGQGYCARVAYTWREAANLVMAYYGVDTRLQTT